MSSLQSLPRPHGLALPFLLLAACAVAAFVSAPLALAQELAGAGRVDRPRALAADSEPDQWLLHGRTWSEQRYSPLDAIDRKSVSRLGPAWSYMTGTRRGMEATPLVVDGVMYLTGSWSRVYALDAATGRELWTFDPQVPGEVGRAACCDVVNRGVAIWKGRVYVGALDGRLIALDARDGSVVWQVQTVDRTRPYTITGAPRVVGDRIVIGNGGADLGVRGYFSAYSAANGALLWRFYTVPAGPDGPHEHPELEMAARTWSRDSRWETGLGGTVWDSMAYDPELDLLYVGVGNSTPYDREVRSPGGGDNLFLTAILAVRPDTGRLVWHYQTTPGETWDYTATQHIVLADLEIAGEVRQVLMQAPKNGFFYVLDRRNGELLSADAYVPISWASHVDLRTGRPVETENAHWHEEARTVRPGPVGGHSWHPMAFSPRSGYVYIPSIDTAYPFHPAPGWKMRPGATFNTAEDWGELNYFQGALPRFRFCSPTHLTAWDPIARKQVWRVEHSSHLPGGVLATAGGLVFQGGDRRLVAYAEDTGAVLWEAPVGISVMAPPISYAIGGEQYIAVLAGAGGSPAQSFEDLPYENHGRVIAWKLGGKAPLPPVRMRAPRSVRVPEIELDPARVEHGARLFGVHCMRCHGVGARATGLMPDLRTAAPGVHEGWEGIVLGGALRGRGMASFADVLSKRDAADIHQYVISQALDSETVLSQAAQWLADNICVPSGWMVD